MRSVRLGYGPFGCKEASRLRLCTSRLLFCTYRTTQRELQFGSHVQGFSLRLRQKLENTNIQKNENVAPTGWICTLSHRAAHDHVTDSWSHQLTSVTFKTRLLEAFLQMWCDDGCRTMPLPLRLFERCERPKSHRLTSFSGSEQDPALVERTLRALDERHESLRTRIGISQRH